MALSTIQDRLSGLRPQATTGSQYDPSRDRLQPGSSTSEVEVELLLTASDPSSPLATQNPKVPMSPHPTRHMKQNRGIFRRFLQAILPF